MAYGLGIDIGTSFTAAAVARRDVGAPAAPEALTLGTRQSAVPSVLFVGDDGQVLIGEAAERRATTRPECVVRGFKRRVGDTVPIMAGAVSVTPADALAMMARWVVDRAQEREGAPPDAITLTHPAGWGEHKLGLLRQSLAGAGIADVALLTEPEAAARHYASQRRVEAGSTVAVYDLGGGTFDAAVVTKHGADSFELLGRPEGLERLGGADFDEAVFEHVVSSLDSPLTDLDPADPEVLTALSRVRRECTEAKEALSYDAEASIPVLIPGRQARIRLVRREFEGMIEDLVHRSIDALGRTLRTAHVDPGELAAILLVGGSSRVPLVAQLLSAEFDRPIAVDADPKASVCLGAAGYAAARLAPLGTGTGAGPEQGAGAPGHGRPMAGSRRSRPHPSSPTAQIPVPAAPSTAASSAAASSVAAPATAALFTRPAATPRPVSGTRLRVRLAGASALLAAVAVLTATAAQTPSGLDALVPLGAGAQAGAPAGRSAAPAGEPPVQKTSTRRSVGGTAATAPEGILLSAITPDPTAPDPTAPDPTTPDPTTPDPTAPDSTTPDATASADAPPVATAGQAPGAVPESPPGQRPASGQSSPVSGASPQVAETPQAARGPVAPPSGVTRDAGPQSPGTHRDPTVPAPAPVPSAGTVPPPAPADPTAAPERSSAAPEPPPSAPAPAPTASEPAPIVPAPETPTPSSAPEPAPPAPSPGADVVVGEGAAGPEGPAPAPALPADPPALQEG